MSTMSGIVSLAQSCGVSLHKTQTSEVMSRRTESEPMSVDRW